MADVKVSPAFPKTESSATPTTESKPAVTKGENGAGSDDGKEEEYKMPENASETLYLQNLNETVRVDCKSSKLAEGDAEG
jgi:hypothetical protein